MKKCCACDKLLNDTEKIHLVPLEKKASWKAPTLGNILAGENGQACATICNPCWKEKRTVQYAVEYQPDVPGLPGINMVYHRIDNLQSF